MILKLKSEVVINQYKKHGFSVNNYNDWLWVNSTDGRYSKDEEYKILRDIGFRYSHNKCKFYCICERTNPYSRYKSITDAYYKKDYN